MKAVKLMPFALMVGANLESVEMVLIKMERGPDRRQFGRGQYAARNLVCREAA